MEFDTGDTLTLIAVVVGLMTLIAFLTQWYKARRHSSTAKAKLPIISFRSNEFPLVITVVNTGERQFSLDRLCFWLSARNNLGQQFDVNLTDIGRVQLEDGGKVSETVYLKRYIDGLSHDVEKYFGWADSVLPWRLKLYFETTIGTKIPVHLSREIRNKLISEIKKNGK